MISLSHLDKYTALEDQVIIMKSGSVVEYGHFTELLNTYESSIRFFCISLKDGQDIQSPKTAKVELRFQERARSFANFDLKSAVASRKTNFDLKSVVPSRKTNNMRVKIHPLARLGLKLR